LARAIGSCASQFEPGLCSLEQSSIVNHSSGQAVKQSTYSFLI
jgi:hypothetical protein